MEDGRGVFVGKRTEFVVDFVRKKISSYKRLKK